MKMYVQISIALFIGAWIGLTSTLSALYLLEQPLVRMNLALPPLPVHTQFVPQPVPMYAGPVIPVPDHDFYGYYNNLPQYPFYDQIVVPKIRIETEVMKVKKFTSM